MLRTSANQVDALINVDPSLHHPWAERSAPPDGLRHDVPAEGVRYDIGSDLASAERSSWKVPERTFTGARLVDAAQLVALVADVAQQVCIGRIDKLAQDSEVALAQRPQHAPSVRRLVAGDNRSRLHRLPAIAVLARTDMTLGVERQRAERARRPPGRNHRVRTGSKPASRRPSHHNAQGVALRLKGHGRLARFVCPLHRDPQSALR